tara:strand:- start:1450 stop:1935 length:486 start_codon:yes stop_codon:yes gene_type:complete
MKIYKLTNEQGLIYIGRTTCKYLSSRLAIHKSQALTSRKIFKCSSYILFSSNVKIELLEETEDKTRELYYINLYDCVNKLKSGLSYKETKKNWIKKNPEYYNLYYHKNKPGQEKIVCECGMVICKYSKSNHIKTKYHKKNIIINKWFSVINSVLTKNMAFH